MLDNQPFLQNKDAATLAQAIVDTVREPLLVLVKDSPYDHARPIAGQDIVESQKNRPPIRRRIVHVAPLGLRGRGGNSGRDVGPGRATRCHRPVDRLKCCGALALVRATEHAE
jgi:hypothetical protein